MQSMLEGGIHFPVFDIPVLILMLALGNYPTQGKQPACLLMSIWITIQVLVEEMLPKVGVLFSGWDTEVDLNVLLNEIKQMFSANYKII